MNMGFRHGFVFSIWLGISGLILALITRNPLWILLIMPLLLICMILLSLIVLEEWK